MQFNNRITLVTNTYDDFGDPVDASTDSVKCALLSKARVTKKDDTGERKFLTMEIMVPHKGFAPYNQLGNSENLMFRDGAVDFETTDVTVINSFAGKPKFYQIKLREVNLATED